MQLVALARYEPAPQIEHVAALELVLYSAVPSQSVHWRSDVAVGAFDTKLPGAHVVAVRHARLPANAVNSVDPLQALHVPPSSYWPAAQGVHARSDVAEGAVVSA